MEVGCKSELIAHLAISWVKRRRVGERYGIFSKSSFINLHDCRILISEELQVLWWPAAISGQVSSSGLQVNMPFTVSTNVATSHSEGSAHN